MKSRILRQLREMFPPNWREPRGMVQMKFDADGNVSESLWKKGTWILVPYCERLYRRWLLFNCALAGFAIFAHLFLNPAGSDTGWLWVAIGVLACQIGIN